MQWCQKSAYCCNLMLHTDELIVHLVDHAHDSIWTGRKLWRRLSFALLLVATETHLQLNRDQKYLQNQVVLWCRCTNSCTFLHFRIIRQVHSGDGTAVQKFLQLSGRLPVRVSYDKHIVLVLPRHLHHDLVFPTPRWYSLLNTRRIIATRIFSRPT